MRSTSIALFACLLSVLCPWGTAQTTSGSLAGTVVDQTGGAIANAKVTATEPSKGVSENAVTDSQGRFTFPQAPPGQYTIDVEAPGFKRLEEKRINHLANQNLSVGILKLQIGELTQSVQVTAQGEQLQTESGERSASLTGKQVTNIALNGRSYLPLVALIPGVTTAPNLPTAGHGGVGSINVNGSRSNQNNLTLDGLGDVDTGNNGDQLATVSLDSVQEFRVLTSNFQAQYGRSSGSQISVVTKSGTNQFHGSGYLYHRHEGLNANNWYNNREGQSRSLFRYNDAGYTLGGPIYGPGPLKRLKNRVFFFSSEEFQEQLKPHGLNQNTVPTALERQGDFSQSVDKNGNPFPYIRDPLAPADEKCNAKDGSACFHDGGVLGRIPQSRLYLPGLNILRMYPLPNAQSPANHGFNYESNISASYPRREDLGRLDLNLNSNNHLFGRFIYNRDSITSPYGSFVLGATIPKTLITDARPGKSLAIGWTSTINPTTVNEFTWGFSKNVINISPNTNDLSRKANGLTNLPILYPGAIQDDFIPRFDFSGTRLANTGSFGTQNAPFFNYNTTIEFIDNLSKVFNQHTVKVGFYAQRSRKNQTSFADANGHYDFQDDASNPFDTGFGFANAAVGVYRGFDQASAYLEGAYRYSNIEWYAQDTWKVKPNFTLDYGIRFYYIQPQYDANLLTSNFLPDRFNPAAAPKLYPPGTKPSYLVGDIVPDSGNLLNGIAQAGVGVSKYLTKSPGITYGPRLGFAWDVTGKQQIVIRGGAGLFYDRYQGNEIFDEITNPPSSFQPSLVHGFASDINPANVVFGPPSLHALDYAGPIPTTASYSLGVQTKLPLQLVLDTAYVGSKAWHLLDQRNLNAIPYGATFQPQNQDPTRNSSTLLKGSGALPVNFLRPYQGYADIALHEFSTTSNFNSLQVSLNRQFAKGLFLGLAYTYSKALGVSSGDGDYVRIDNLTRFANYGPLAFDHRHTLAINYIYPFPDFFLHHAIAHAVLDGWQISGLTRLQSGGPYEAGFSVPGYNNQNLTGSYTEPARLQVAGDPLKGVSQTGPYGWLNPSAFSPPQPYPSLGGLGLGEGRYPFYGPGINNTDLSVAKNFYLGEGNRFAVLLRVDAFNFANHPQFGGVGGTGVSNNSGINSTLNFASLSGGVTNVYKNPDGSIHDIHGFGTVTGARDPRILMLTAKITF